MIKSRHILMLSVFLYVEFARVLWAQSGIYPHQDLVDVTPGSRGFNTYVNVVDGNLIHLRPEFYIPGRGLPLTVVLVYNSTNPEEGPFGYGWQMNYALCYAIDNDSGNVSITRADGRIDLFIKQANGTYRATQGVRDQLEALAQGYGLTVWRDAANNNGDYAVYTFASPDHAYATEIEDRNGNTLTLSYGNDGLLTTVTDGPDRKIQLAYANGRLAALTDPGARQWHYAYDAQGNLIKVTNPVGKDTQYAYDAGNHRCLGVTNARGGVYQFAYNPDGAVTSVTDSLDNAAFSFGYLDCCMTIVTNGNGHDTTYTYDENTRVISITDALGGEIIRTWDDAFNLSSLTNPKGRTTTYTYDARGNLLTQTDPLGNTLSYTWEQSYNNKTSYTDGNGSITTYADDDRGNLVTRTDALGNATTYDYDTSGQVTAITNARGHTSTYAYDAFGNLTRAIDALAGRTVSTYDAWGNVLSKTHPSQNTTTYEYDRLGRLVKTINALGGETTYTYDALGNLISATNAKDQTITYTYDALNRLATRTNAMGGVDTYTYDAVGNRIRETDTKDNATTYTYDPVDRLIKITNAQGAEKTYTHDAAGNLSSETNARGHTTRYTYDAVDRVIEIVNTLGATVTFTYDAMGNKLTETNANGHTTSFAFDALDRLVSVENPLGAITSFTYDAMGNNTSRTDAQGHQVRFTYDALDRLASTQDALGGTVTWAYDAVGNVVRRIDENGNTTQYTYDALNRHVSIVDALDGAMTYTYDAIGNTTSRADQTGHATHFGYDALNRHTRTTTPPGHQWRYAYDTNGNRVRRTDANGDITTYTYDALNQRTRTNYPDGHVAWEYDAAGNLLRATNHRSLNDETLYEYDAMGRIMSQTLDYGSAMEARTIRYEYDRDGQRIKTIYPDGEEIAYQYDKAARITTLKGFTGTTTYAYDAAGRRIQMNYPNGASVAYEYDDNNRTISLILRKADGSIAINRAYAYDAADNKTSETQNEINADRQIQYDALNRISSVTYHLPDTEVHEYTYDAAGRRLTQTVNGQVTTFTYDADGRVTRQVTPTRTIDYAYDNNGNRIRRTGSHRDFTYVWDYENRLTGCIWPPNTDLFLTYAYSAQGLKLLKFLQDWEMYFSYDGTRIISEQGMGELYLYNPGISAQFFDRRIHPVYDNAGTSVAEIWSNSVHPIVFDEFGRKLRGSLEPLIQYDSAIYDRDLGGYWDDYDPVTATTFSAYKDIVELAQSFVQGAAEPPQDQAPPADPPQQAVIKPEKNKSGPGYSYYDVTKIQTGTSSYQQKYPETPTTPPSPPASPANPPEPPAPEPSEAEKIRMRERAVGKITVSFDIDPGMERSFYHGGTKEISEEIAVNESWQGPLATGERFGVFANENDAAGLAAVRQGQGPITHGTRYSVTIGGDNRTVYAFIWNNITRTYEDTAVISIREIERGIPQGGTPNQDGVTRIEGRNQVWDGFAASVNNKLRGVLERNKHLP